jgi:hypothetical protein
MTWSSPLATLLRAGIAATRGDVTSAEAFLVDATRGLGAADMALYAAAARWQRGRLLGSDAGREETRAASAWAAGEGVVDWPRMATPGFDG